MHGHEPLKSELDAYFHFHGLRGTLLKELDKFDEAREALNRAIALANSVAEAKLIRRELDRLGNSAGGNETGLSSAGTHGSKKR
jgi:RNA polymerase sigma-70 factor (ECF subfamily)